MPSCPMAMPSVTVMVVNSRGVPLACFTPSFTDWAWRFRAMLQGAASFQQVATPTNGLVDLIIGQPHRVVIRAVRRAGGALGHIAAR